MAKTNSSRRKFLLQLGGSALMLSAGSASALASGDQPEPKIIPYERKISANDRIRIGVVGIGIMGFNDLSSAIKVPGVELGGVCDLYTGRLQRAKELYGKELFTTRDYRELLQRKDIDAIVIATSDNWHARISVDAMNAGKAVYCEKPMVHKFSEGPEVIATQQRTQKTLQVGSQVASSIAWLKARELYKSGEIGQLTSIEANTDRQNSLGAWEYTQPLDGSPTSVDWDRYIEGMPKEPFDPKKFFWWRNYRDFGTGVSGDLFIHLITGIHLVTGSLGPERIFSSAQLSYWKDGRDVPDVMTGILQYGETKEHPAFQVNLRVNLISGQGENGSTRFFGTEGVMQMEDNGFTIQHHKLPKAPGFGRWDALGTYPKSMQDELTKSYDQKYSVADRKSISAPLTVYRVPDNYNEDVDHFNHFFEGMRTGKPVIEDAVFGYRAAAPCLAANESYFKKKIIEWDPVNMKLV